MAIKQIGIHVSHVRKIRYPFISRYRHFACVFISVVAGLLHASAGSINYVLVGNLLIGSIPAVLLGSNLSAKVPTRPLRTVVAAIVIFSGLKLID